MNYLLEGEEEFQRFVYQLKMLFVPFQDNNYCPDFLQSNVILYCVVLLLILKVMTIGFFLPWPQNIFFADITRTDLVKHLNQSRQNAGLNILVENDILNRAASLKAHDMVDKGYFSHKSPKGVSPWFWFGQAGYDYRYAGENLAIGFIDSGEVFEAWLNSPSHKANVLNDNYQEVGTAILDDFGGSNTTIVVQLFGSIKKNPNLASSVKINTKAPDKKPDIKVVTNQLEEKVIEQNILPESNTQPDSVIANNSVVSRKVLGQSTQIAQLSNNDKNIKNSFYVRFINFIVYDYERLMAYVSYILLISVSIVLLLNILINFNIHRERLIAKSILVLAIILCILFLDKSLIGQVIVHQVII